MLLHNTFSTQSLICKKSNVIIHLYLIHRVGILSFRLLSLTVMIGAFSLFATLDIIYTLYSLIQLITEHKLVRSVGFLSWIFAHHRLHIIQLSLIVHCASQQAFERKVKCNIALNVTVAARYLQPWLTRNALSSILRKCAKFHVGRRWGGGKIFVCEISP